MISILLPVYNYDVTLLVNSLSQALSKSGQFGEIVIGSDGCDADNLARYQSLTSLQGVRIFRSDKNIGRAAIRNRLSEVAGGEHLLFIDADALVTGNASDYFDKWMAVIGEAPVICGGTAYPPVPPHDPDKYLRWHYGSKREQKPAKERNKDPYASFSGFNFLVEKSVMDRVRFNEDLVKYGHEDTLLGYQLKNAGIKILHIDNTLIHDGVESNRDFLYKTAEGVQNLSLLYDTVTDKANFRDAVTILRIYNRIRLIGLAKLLMKYFVRHRRRLEIVLIRKKTSLWVFAFYKLGLLAYTRLHKS